MQAKVRTEFTDTPLVDAAAYGRAADVVALLADGANVNEPMADGFGYTALHFASQAGQTEVVTTLLAANANVHHARNNGDTPLALAKKYRFLANASTTYTTPLASIAGLEDTGPPVA